MNKYEEIQERDVLQNKEPNYLKDIECADKPHIVVHWHDGKSMTIPVERLYEFDTHLYIETPKDQNITIPLPQVRWYSVNNYARNKERLE